MDPDCRRHRALAIAIIAIGTTLPLLLYGLVFSRGLAMPKPQAQRMLAANTAVLVDVDPAPPAATTYPAGATRWPLSSILQTRTPADVPRELRSRTLLLMCPGGIQSARAALHLRHLGIGDAFAIRGGLQGWLAAVPGCPQNVLLHGNPATDATIPSFRTSPVYEQWLAVLTFFGVKALYTLISAAIIIALWRRTEPDLAALRRAMLFFFIGEAFCFINVMVFFEDSFLMEFLHSTGMVLALAYTVYALLEGVDSRLIHFSDGSRCAAAALCGRCIKHTATPCGLHRTFMLL
ncbi:MAG: rhodanese-like domain-containing protein, partial [Tepidisphaeraceae bacterium]